MKRKAPIGWDRPVNVERLISCLFGSGVKYPEGASMECLKISPKVYLRGAELTFGEDWN